MPWLLSLLLLGAAPSLLEQAQARERAGDDAGALRDADAAVKQWPADALARLEAARLRMKLGQALEEAEQHLEVARSIAPENPRVHFLWGRLMEDLRKPAEALRAYEVAVSFRPLFEDARFRLGALYAQRGDWLRSELHYRALAAARPEWVQVRVQLARALEQQGRVEDAEQELMALREEQPESLPATRALAELYERTGRAAEAARLRDAGAPKKMRPLKKSKR